MLDLNKDEESILEYWKKNDILNKVRARNKNRKPFYFLDGPPYVTGELASHHVWVETIKDLVLRYKRYRRFDVHDRAGFDVHGLPIEVKVEKRLNIGSKKDIEDKIGVENFIIACKEYAKEQAESAIKIYTRFASSLDFEHVYLPYENYYINKGWFIFKEMYENGLLYKDLSPLAYCPKDETVLSAQGPEVEYSDETDASLFVKFRIRDKSKAKIQLPDNVYLVVWTTTPWTLPANMAIAANPGELYVIASANNENYILAKNRLDSFASLTNLSIVVSGEFYGSELEGINYSSPLEEQVPKQKEFSKFHKVILSDSFVNVNEGTGLLHVAPGHGPEDYKLGKQHKMPIFSPVDEHAKYTAEAGKLEGLKIPEDANKQILDLLKNNKSLMHLGSITHSYPHCWRCNSKLIFRATEQWFINVQKLKKKMLRANEQIIWHPAEAREWFKDAIESSPDWCVSRQRYWGAPIPIWICGSCKEFEVIGSVEELMQRGNLEQSPKELHKPHVDRITFQCKKCNTGIMHRIPDVFDVWYDSGIAHTASLTDEEFMRLFPADWITESRDQIRGWFTALLRTSIAAYGTKSFNRVNIGGMIKDEMGQEMHRHLGNTVSARELLTIASADAFRFWCASHPRWLELKLKKPELVEFNGNIITIYNVAALVKELMELSNVKNKKVRKPSAKNLDYEEAWILSRFSSLIDDVTKDLDNYFIDVATNKIKDFILEDLSRFYLKIAKKKISYGNKKQTKLISDIVNYIFFNTLVLIAPVTPFVAERLYTDAYAYEESIFLEDWPKSNKAFVNKQLEEDFEIAKDVITAILNSREKAGMKLRWPSKRATIEVTDDGVYNAIMELGNLIESYTNVKKLEVNKVVGTKQQVKPIFAKLGPEFKGNASTVAQELAKTDANMLLKELEVHGYYGLHTDKGIFNIKPEHFAVVESVEEGDAVAFKHGRVWVSREISKELREEGLLREFERRVQLARRDSQLKRIDKIALNYKVPTEYNDIIKKNASRIKKELNIKELSDVLDDNQKTMEFDVEEEKILLQIRKL